MRRIFLNDISEGEISRIKSELPFWLSLHLDYDNELSILIESFGEKEDTPLCNPICKYCYTIQIPEKIKKELLIYSKDLMPHDIINNPNVKNIIIKAKKYSEKFKIPLRLYISGKGLKKDLLDFILKNVDIFDVSLNSPNPLTRSKMMNINIKQAEYEIELIRNIKEKNKVTLNNVIMEDNIKEVREILEFGKSYLKNVLIPIGVTKWTKLRALTKEERKNVIELSRNYKNAVLCSSFFSELKEYLPLFIDGMSFTYKPKLRYLFVTTKAFAFLIEEISKRFNQKYLIVESSFGGNISAAGLMLGRDLIRKLKTINLSDIDIIIVPYLSVQDGYFIDGVSLNKIFIMFNKFVIRGPKDYRELNEFLKECDHEFKELI